MKHWLFAVSIFGLSELARVTLSYELYECTEESPCDVVSCGTPEECFVHCNGNSSCIGAVINCDSSSNCTVHCDGANSCTDASIYGQDAKDFYLTVDGTANTTLIESVHGATIFCPVDDDIIDKNCNIFCPKGIGKYEATVACDGIDIYTTRGMANLHFGPVWETLRDTRIFCGDTYQFVCPYGTCIN